MRAGAALCTEYLPHIEAATISSVCYKARGRQGSSSGRWSKSPLNRRVGRLYKYSYHGVTDSTNPSPYKISCLILHLPFSATIKDQIRPSAQESESSTQPVTYSITPTTLARPISDLSTMCSRSQLGSEEWTPQPSTRAKLCDLLFLLFQMND
ncbi:hypothetical protein N656DRAFT_525369 [Canariomyces notabilis]|uniref:Uncharacterized protein n=1 Tax=Canariomyces notabilis TaxID=2074819 RepID=A0AAN6QBJ6_9PEZI|nr:hypothetical protein N656DRAFT_525369 [Canariomyces arenarius]